MSSAGIQAQINRIHNNIESAFDMIESRGGVVTSRVSDKLSSAIQTISSGGSSNDAVTLLGAQLGRDWFVSESINFGTKQILSIARGPDRFVGVGYTGTLVYSDDGLTWTMGEMPKDSGNAVKWNYVAWVHDRFIASNQNKYGSTKILAHSFDGINWSIGTTDITYNSVYNIIGFCYGNGKYVAVNQNSGNLIVSEDGANWTTIHDETIDGSASDVTYCGGRFFVATGSKIVFVTSNLENVTKLTPTSTAATYTNIDSYGDVIVVSATNYVLVSKDGGDTWRTITLKTEAGSSVQGDIKPFCLNGVWFFTGTTFSDSSNPGFVLYTKDFDTWKRGEYPYHYREERMGMAYGSGKLLMAMNNVATPLISIGSLPTDI